MFKHNIIISWPYPCIYFPHNCSSTLYAAIGRQMLYRKYSTYEMLALLIFVTLKLLVWPWFYTCIDLNQSNGVIYITDRINSYQCRNYLISVRTKWVGRVEEAISIFQKGISDFAFIKYHMDGMKLFSSTRPKQAMEPTITNANILISCSDHPEAYKNMGHKVLEWYGSF